MRRCGLLPIIDTGPNTQSREKVTAGRRSQHQRKHLMKFQIFNSTEQCADPHTSKTGAAGPELAHTTSP